MEHLGEATRTNDKVSDGETADDSDVDLLDCLEFSFAQLMGPGHAMNICRSNGINPRWPSHHFDVSSSVLIDRAFMITCSNQ